MLDLHLIRIDGGTQSRAKLNNDLVAEYVEAYKAGAKFPAVTVFYDGKDRWLADGFHRYHAAKQAGKKTILENIIPGTLRDARFHSWKANQEHGQRRTNEDKRNIVLAVLADEEAGKWSDNHIAKEFGFSQPFVSGLRASLITVISEKPAERTYTTKQGTTATMRTGGIGKAKPETEKPVSPAPVVAPKQDDEGAPDEAEFDSLAASEKADAAAMQLLLASDAPLADVTEKYKQSLLMIERLNARIVGLQNQSLHQISEIKRLKKKLDRMEQPA